MWHMQHGALAQAEQPCVLVLVRIALCDSHMQPWSSDYATTNYVQYQRYRASDGTTRTDPSALDSCLVVATGASYPALVVGLGAVHPNCAW